MGIDSAIGSIEAKIVDDMRIRPQFVRIHARDVRNDLAYPNTYLIRTENTVALTLLSLNCADDSCDGAHV